VTVPPLAQQRRIAAVLDRAEALRAKRRAALAELDSLTQSLFLDLFGDPTSQTQSLPIQPLESLLAQPLQNGAYYPKENYTQVGGVEMVHMSDAFYEIVPRGNLKRVLCSESDIQKYALTENDILIARRSLTLEGAAKPCLIPKSNEPLIFESSFIRVTPQPGKITALYLYHYLGNERVKQKCVQPFITQSTISGINQSNLERVPVIVPPLALQHKFARQVTAVENLKAAHRASLAELDALFATLQHRAFRGEL
jgi:type I restriction enzyme S subunit